jgi:hypothetical protein
MFCTRKIHALSLLLLTATTIRVMGTERELTFNGDRREERGVMNASTGLAVLSYLVGGAAVALVAEKCMPLNNDKSIIYRWTGANKSVSRCGARVVSEYQPNKHRNDH